MAKDEYLSNHLKEMAKLGKISEEDVQKKFQEELRWNSYIVNFCLETSNPELSVQARISTIIGLLAKGLRIKELFIHYPDQGWTDKHNFDEEDIKKRMKEDSFQSLISGEKDIILEGNLGGIESIVLGVNAKPKGQQLNGVLYLGPKEDKSNYTSDDIFFLKEMIALAIKYSVGNAFNPGDFDELTQLYRRGAFDLEFEHALNSSLRTKRPLSLLMVDVDHFKKINDTYGHVLGDLVLREVGKLLLKGRIEDKAGRYGGEEFTKLLPTASFEDAYKIANELREEMSNLDLPLFYEFIYAYDQHGNRLSSDEYHLIEDNRITSIKTERLSDVEHLNIDKLHRIKRKITKDEFEETKHLGSVGKERITASIGISNYPQFRENSKLEHDIYINEQEGGSGSSLLDVVKKHLIKYDMMVNEYLDDMISKDSDYQMKSIGDMSIPEERNFLKFAMGYNADREVYNAKKAGRNTVRPVIDEGL